MKEMKVITIKVWLVVLWGHRREMIWRKPEEVSGILFHSYLVDDSYGCLLGDN